MAGALGYRHFEAAESAGRTYCLPVNEIAMNLSLAAANDRYFEVLMPANHLMFQSWNRTSED
jgi:hypothetical protein